MTKQEKLLKLAELKNPELQMERLRAEQRNAEDIIKELTPPQEGPQGPKGEDGYTPIKGVDYYTEDEIRQIISEIQLNVKDGNDGRNGVDGKDGKDGQTPIRLVDYWTKEDQDKIIKEVLLRVPKPQDGKTPDTKEIVNEVVDILKKNPIEFKDIKGTEKLVEFLKLGGFRGGGISNITGLIEAGTDITITGTGTATDPYIINASVGTITGTIDAPEIAFGTGLDTIGGNPNFVFDTTYLRQGIGTTSPNYALDVTGQANSVTPAVFTGSGLDDATSGGPYIGNFTTNILVEIDAVNVNFAGSIKYTSGTGSFLGDTITADNGATGTVLTDDGTSISFTDLFTGDWTLATTFSGSPSTNTATILVALNGSISDTFLWTQDGIFQGGGNPIDGTAQDLFWGASIQFAATTGHTSSDQWTFTAVNLNIINTDTYRISGSQNGSISLVSGSPNTGIDIVYQLPPYYSGVPGLFLQDATGTGIFQWNYAPGTFLSDGHIFVGDVAGNPQDVAMSGDVSIDDTGATLVLQGHLPDYSLPSPPATGLTFQSYSPHSFSMPYVFDGQGNAIEMIRDNMRVVKNNSGGGIAIQKGEVVYVSGSDGSILTVKKAKADIATTMPALGIAYERITDNKPGRILLLGEIANIDMSAFSNGDKLYVSTTIAGGLTNVAPASSNIQQFVGTVVNNGVTTGVLQVRFNTQAPTASTIIGGQAVTRTDDTNVTMTLNAPSSVAALAAYSMTLGWTGTLAPARGGTGVVTGRPYFSTLFEGPATGTRFTQTNVLGGTAAFIGNGVDLDTSATGSSSALISYAAGISFNVFKRIPIWYCNFALKTINKSGTYYIGMGDVAVNGAGHTFTNNHIGWKITVSGAGVASLFATQADGTTENASSALTTVAANDCVEVYIVENPTAGFDYYWVLNNGALSAATNLGTTNLPLPAATSSTWIQVSASNSGSAVHQEIIASEACYGR